MKVARAIIQSIENSKHIHYALSIVPVAFFCWPIVYYLVNIEFILAKGEVTSHWRHVRKTLEGRIHKAA